jgi:hypothetical protein
MQYLTVTYLGQMKNFFNILRTFMNLWVLP